MFHLRTAPTLLFALSIWSCGPPAQGGPNSPAETTTSDPHHTDPIAPPNTEGATAESKPARPHTARLVETSAGGRHVELLSGDGTVIETLAPGDFTQTLRVPDIAGNSMEMISQEVSGTDIVAASVDPETGRALLAVRGFIYAEVSTDMVFLLRPRGKDAEESASERAEPIYFDGPDPRAGGDAPRPHLDVSAVSFGPDDSLLIETADASGGSSRLVYGPNGVARGCNWTGGESRRCPNGVQPTVD